VIEATQMSAGTSIRKLREDLQLRSSDVERISRGIAQSKNNPDYYVSHASLADIESGSTPSIYKLFSLAAALRISYEKILTAFGIDPAELSVFRQPDLTETHIDPIQDDRLEDESAPLEVHARNDLIRDPVERLQMPRSLRHRLDPVRYVYARIGSSDDSMGDVIPPGSLVEIDKEDTEIRTQQCSSLRERPVYFVWFRDGYLCCWCEKKGSELITIPHPLSRGGSVQRFRLPRDARVVGRVVHAWVALKTP
jgi:transcriptional regulator with XRE-family HTH domain